MKCARSRQEKRQSRRCPGKGAFPSDLRLAQEPICIPVPLALTAEGKEPPEGGGLLLAGADAAGDLRREAANMLELACSQSGHPIPLHLSSQKAQAVLKQF